MKCLEQGTKVSMAKDDNKVDKSSKYLCTSCNQTFSDKSNLRRHEKRQHEEVREGNNKCESCSKTFTRHGDLCRHITKCAMNRTCKVCNITFTCPQNLRRHIKNKHTLEDADRNDDKDKNENTSSNHSEFECTSCLKTFRNESSLKRHTKVCNQSEEDTKAYCKECKKFFFDFSTLSKHVRRKHRDHKRVETNGADGNSSFADSNTINNISDDTSDDAVDRKHTMDSDTGTDKESRIKGAEDLSNERQDSNKKSLSSQRQADYTALTCTFCKLKYSRLSNLRRHMNKVHKRDETDTMTDNDGDLKQEDLEPKADRESKIHSPLKTCEKCNASFKKGTEWNEHLKIHRLDRLWNQTDAKEYCHICGKSFKSHGGYYKHMRAHAGYKVSCKICSKTFTATHTLEIHMRSHKGEKPYQCEICGSRFSQQSHLKRHLDSHAGERKFPCLICNKSFMDASALRAHERSHSGFKPYECTICSYKTSFVSSLATHKKIHNMKRDFVCKICERTFTQKHALLRHEVMHEKLTSSAKPGFMTKPTLFCNQCPKGFTSKRGLTRHIQKHTKGLLKSVIRRETGDSEGQTSEKGPDLISSVHGHYEADTHSEVYNNSTAQNNNVEQYKASGHSEVYNNSTGQGEAEIFRQRNNTETRSSTTVVVNHVPIVQNINTSENTDIADLLETCKMNNLDITASSQELKAACRIKEAFSRRSKQQFPNNILGEVNVSQNGILTTGNDSQNQASKLAGYTISAKDSYGIAEDHTTNIGDNRMESSHTEAIDDESNKINRSSYQTISQHGNIVVLNRGDLNTNISDGLNTLSNVVCNLEIGNASEWETFRFSEPLEGSKSILQINRERNGSKNKAYIIETEDNLNMKSPSSNCENTTVSDEETIVVGQDKIHNNTPLDNLQEIQPTQSLEPALDFNDVSQVEQISYEPDVDAAKDDIIGSKDIAPKDECVTIVKLKSDSDDQELVCSVCSLSFESDTLLARHMERAHIEVTKSTETKQLHNSKDVRCKMQCLKCNTKFHSFVKYKRHVKQKCERTMLKSSVLHTADRNYCGTENSDVNANGNIIVVGKDDIKTEEAAINKEDNKDHSLSCYYCGKHFSFLNSLTFHERKHSEPASHICEICGRGFYKPYYLKRHLALHENKTEDTCYCSECGKMFQKVANLETHMRIHMGLDPYPCTLCEKTFTNSSNLKRHLKSHGDGNEHTEIVHSYYCHLCGKGYTAKASLQDHLNTHSGVKPHSCPHCSASFTQSAHLRRHLKSHSGERSVKCDVCDKLFYDTSTMKIHMRSHTGEKPYSCSVCGQCFTQSQNLRVHELKHNGLKKFRCSVCQQDFTTKMSLERHGKRHEREGILDPEMKTKRYMTVKKMKDKVVPCPDCDRHFTTRKSMLAHLRTACSQGHWTSKGSTEKVVKDENTGTIHPSSDPLEETKESETSNQVDQETDPHPKHTLEIINAYSAEPLSLVREKVGKDELERASLNHEKITNEESEGIETTADIHYESAVIKQTTDTRIDSDSVTSEDRIPDSKHSFVLKTYSDSEEKRLPVKHYAYPSRTVIFYNEQGSSTHPVRKENVIHQVGLHEEHRVGSRNAQYESERDSFKQASVIKEQNNLEQNCMEKQIHESVDNIAESMVSFMQEKKEKTFTDVEDSPRVRVYPRVDSDSAHIRVYSREQHNEVEYIEDGSEMSIVHVVEDTPYTEIVIEDVPGNSRVQHSEFVPGYTEPVRFSQFQSYSSHASNSPMPTPPGSFSASSTSQPNVITSVFAPGMLGVPLNLVTLGSMHPVSVDQTSQEQYFHQEPQWRMPCP